MSSRSKSFASASASSNSRVAAWIASEVFAAATVAPRIPRVGMASPFAALTPYPLSRRGKVHDGRGAFLCRVFRRRGKGWGWGLTKKPRGRVPRGFEHLLLQGVYSNASNGTGAGAVKVRVKVEAQTAFHTGGKIAHIGERSQALLTRFRMVTHRQFAQKTSSVFRLTFPPAHAKLPPCSPAAVTSPTLVPHPEGVSVRRACFRNRVISAPAYPPGFFVAPHPLLS